MQRLFVLFCICLVGVVHADEKPNVLVLFTDDQGTFDLNCYGSSDLSTPNLDALAEEGLRFTQFYAASAVCSPSRAGLLTGRYPHRAGVPGNAESHPTQFGSGHGLKEKQMTMAEVFKQAGYTTGHFGKWHLGFEPGPNRQGFDLSVGFMGGCIDKFSHINYGQAPWGQDKWHDWYRNGVEEWATGRHSGDLIVDEAIQFIKNAEDKPWFIYAAFGTPHYPMNAYNKHWYEFQHLDEPRRSYAAVMATLDEQIGRLVDAIDSLGLRENTIIVFQSDHGHSNEARNNYGGGNAGHLRGAKASLFEGGLRVPAIISWPGQIAQKETRHQMAVSCDWLPTLAEFCNVPLTHSIDGKSIVSVIQNNSESPHDVWHWALRQQWAVRKGNWKLLRNINDTSDGRNKKRVEGPFLVNLAEDESELKDVATEHAEILQELLELHNEWEVWVSQP